MTTRALRNVQITLTISEIDGKLDIIAQIPDGSEDSVAYALAMNLMEGAKLMMNDITGQRQNVKAMSKQ